MRRLLPPGVVVLLVAVPALGQPSPTGQQVEVVPEVTSDAIRALAERLRMMPGGNLPDGLRDQFRELMERNPGATPQQLAEQLAQQNPGLRQNPGQLAELQRYADQFRGKFPSGQIPSAGGLNLPNVPDGGGQPGGRPERSPADAPGPLGRPGPSEPRPSGPTELPRFQLPKGNPTELPPTQGGLDLNGLRPPEEVNTSEAMRLANGQRWTGDPEQFRLREQQFQQVKDVWERNVGPLESTPAVRQALTELFLNRAAVAEGNGGGPFADLFQGAQGTDAGRFAENALGQSGWKMPDLGLMSGWKLDGFADGFSAPDMPTGPSVGGFGGVGVPGGESWLSVILFGAVAALALVLWWLWPKLTGKVRDDGPQPLPGLGPWPVDPRTIADREALVKAFEYLSVLRLGSAARVWNHVTIATVLRDAVPAADEVADPLARLYAVARYTPADEPIPPAAIAEARRHLCRLAGVPVV